MPSGVSKLGTVYMPLEGLIDVQAETQRLSAQLEKVRNDIERTSSKLNNRGFVSKAPPEVVEEQTKRKAELIEKSESWNVCWPFLAACEIGDDA